MLRVAAREGALVPVNQPASRAFAEFFDEESGTLFRRMWLVTRDRQEAEDIMQDSFLAVFERWDRVAQMDDPTGYLYRTAFNLWRRRMGRAARAVRAVLDTRAPGDDFEAAEARTVIGSGLARLAPRQRAAIILTELLGYSSDEAGSILGIRAVTARVLASQARAALRQGLATTDE